MLCQICGRNPVTKTCTLCGAQTCDPCSAGPLCRNCASKARFEKTLEKPKLPGSHDIQPQKS